MERTGTVVSTEKVGIQTSIVIKGFMDVHEGQHLRNGDRVWTITKKHWVRKPHVSLLLNHVHGKAGQPEQGDVLELVLEPAEGENGFPAIPDLTVETVVRFEKQTVICVRGVLPTMAGDLLTDGERAWKVVDVTEAIPASPGKTWLTVKNHQGTQHDPAPNAQLLKKS
jgi:hypothetical protein